MTFLEESTSFLGFFCWTEDYLIRQESNKNPQKNCTALLFPKRHGVCFISIEAFCTCKSLSCVYENQPCPLLYLHNLEKVCISFKEVWKLINRYHFLSLSQNSAHSPMAIYVRKPVLIAKSGHGLRSNAFTSPFPKREDKNLNTAVKWRATVSTVRELWTQPEIQLELMSRVIATGAENSF